MFKRKTFLLLLAASFVVASCSADSGSQEPSTSDKPGEVYAIGDIGPGGGIVFITPSGAGNATGKYFEAAPYVDEALSTWCSTIDTLLGTDGTAIGTGATNTATAFCSSGAIHIASNYSNNDFSDWFLPSQDELNEMYTNRKSLGGFSTGTYWSSSELGANHAWLQVFNLGPQPNFNKDYPFYVRPVRAFS